MHSFVLVGHGGIARKYVEALGAVDEAEIVGVVGRDSKRAAAFAEEHAIPVHGTDLDAVSRVSGATAVVVCTPNALHHHGVLAASALGLHCLCEKPMHIRRAVQDEMIESCREHGVKLGVSYMRRFAGHMRYIKERMDAGMLGEIQCVDINLRTYRPPEYYGTKHGTYDLDGGGVLMQQGSHNIDMALWLCGGYDRVVDASRFRVLHDIEAEDHCYATMQYSNGAIGSISVSTACRGLERSRIEISGTRGTIAADFDGISSFEVPGLQAPTFKEDPDLFVALVRDFVEAIDADRKPLINGEQAKLATECVLDIYERSGEPDGIRRRE